jgi:hypothetical protein
MKVVGHTDILAIERVREREVSGMTPKMLAFRVAL